MSRAFTLRRASVNDVDLLLEFREAMWQEGAAEIDSADASEALENARMYFRREGAERRIRLLSGRSPWPRRRRWRGVPGPPPPRPHSPRGIEGYILNMLTVSEWRRKGIASAIMGELLACAGEAGAVQVALRASEDGRRVYEKFGFESNPHYMQMALE
jgi:GNAT superfamily N-acetyltransferase